MFWPFWSFTRYQDLTVHSSRFRVVLVILEVLGLFWSSKWFMVFFFSFLFFLDVLWFWGYFGNFESMLATLVISRVFLSKFPTLNIYIYIFYS